MTQRVDPTLVILLSLVVLIVVLGFAKDSTLPLRGLMASAKLVRGVWLELLLGFVLAGLLEVLIPQPMLLRWLGAERLGQGIVVGWAAGLVIPGGPYLFFPVAANRAR